MVQSVFETLTNNRNLRIEDFKILNAFKLSAKKEENKNNESEKDNKKNE